MNFTMVGVSGSGKTTFMSAIERVLYGTVPRNDLFSIDAIPLDANPRAPSTTEEILALGGDFAAISFSANGWNFPESTRATTVWSFNLKYDHAVVAPFYWIDYRGGAVTDAAEGDFSNDDVGRLIRQIDISSAVLLFADAFLLSHYKEIEDIEVARFHAGIDSLFRVFNSYHEANRNRRLVYLLVLTKSDDLGIDDPKQYEALLDLGEEAFQPIIQVAQKAGWSGGIVGVSAVGTGRVKRVLLEEGDFRTLPQIENELIRPPRPVNIDAALFHCVASVFEKMLVGADQSAAELREKIEDALAQDTVLKGIWGWITNTESPRDIAKAYMRMREKDLVAARHYEKYLKPLNEQSRNVIRRIR